MSTETLPELEEKRRPLERILLGTAYNIFHDEFSTDQAFCQRVDRDLANMRAAHLNAVLVFPVGQWDPTTRQLQWDRTDYLVRRLQEQGLDLVPILFKEQQCRHYLPIWQMHENPSIWSAHLSPHPSSPDPNSREDADINHPAVASALDEYFEAVINRYRQSPSLLLYNVWNEPHYQARGHQAAVERFRAWLKQKYTDLGVLGRVWGEDYTDWQQVTPRITDDWDSSMPAIDWALFSWSENARILERLRGTVRRLDPTRAVVANPVGSLWTNPGGASRWSIDDWPIAAESDVVGISHYPDQWERELGVPYPAYRHAFVFNHVRCAAAGKPYILNELQTYGRHGFALHGYLSYDDLYVISWLALAHDCKGILYWKWLPFLRGRQSFGRGLCQTNGELAERGRAVQDIGTVLDHHGRLLYAAGLVPARAGMLLHDVGLLKTLQASESGSPRLFMKESYEGTFRALWDAHVPVDVLRMDRPLALDDLSRYRILYLPLQIVMPRHVADLLRSYVREGGWLVADARTAIMDDRDFGYAVSPGAGLATLFGVERLDFCGNTQPHLVEISDAAALGLGLDSPLRFAGAYFREKLRLLPGAEVVARFADTGEPALVLRPEARGMAVLSAVPLGATYLGDPSSLAGAILIGLAARAQALLPVRFSAPGHAAGVELKLHCHASGWLIYLVNTGEAPVLGRLHVPAPFALPCSHARELISDAPLCLEREHGGASVQVALAAKRAVLIWIEPAAGRDAAARPNENGNES